MNPKRLWQAGIVGGTFMLLVIAFLMHGERAFHTRFGLGNAPSRTETLEEQKEIPADDVVEDVVEEDIAPERKLEIYDWWTRSSFKPVSQPIAQKSMQQLCEAFPHNLLDDIQPVLKTGHSVLQTRVQTHLDSASACLGDNLLIVSDVSEDFAGYQVHDVVSDLREEFLQDNDQLESYVLLREHWKNGTLMSEAASRVEGWKTDKFKFLPQVSRAWHLRPEKKWYVFYEDDTYVVWDNMFRLLNHFDPDMPWYFGSPSPGARGFWMANGGPGYVLSREAVRRLVKGNYDDQGAFTPALSQRWEDQMMHDCCGDSVLGLAVHEDARTELSGLFPMFQPHPLHGIPFSDIYWCQPVISMHKNWPENMVTLRRWEESRRKERRPLLFADLVDYLNLTRIEYREDWSNSDFGGHRAPDESAYASFDACGRACKADPDCLQWSYHLRTCTFVPSIRLGQPREPEIEKWRSEEEKNATWTEEELRFFSGWDLDSIKKWMDGDGRDCKTVKWVRPSIERIF